MKDYYETSDGSKAVPDIVDEFFAGMNERIKVVLVRALKAPEVVEIASGLESMQEVVGGLIEQIMPFEEEVAIVCNEEGKMLKLDLNRALKDENGEIYDIIAGTFIICSASGEKFGSLTELQLKRYCEMFKNPERFYLTSEGIKVISVIPF